MDDVLPDVLALGLPVVFCGSAAGQRSAQARAYYAGPGNRFWPVLYRIGLTPRLLAPGEYAQVLDFGIGLTDLAKGRSGADSEIATVDYDVPRLRAAIGHLRPRALAFNGKRAGQLFLGDKVSYGMQPTSCGATALFVLPSTSGAARRFWDEGPWRDLAAWLRN
jgi:TDG/mug DNA glycosylase family protein